MKTPGKYRNHAAQPSRGTKRSREEEEIMTKQTKKNCNNGTALEQSVEKTTRGLLLEGKLILNFDAAPNYKPMIGPQRSHLTCLVRRGVIYLICETSLRNTYKQKHCNEEKQKQKAQSQIYECVFLLTATHLFHLTNPNAMIITRFNEYCSIFMPN